MNPNILNAVNEKLQIILDEAIFDERTEHIFRLHYGINCVRKEPKLISKEIKLPLKKLKFELTKIDNKIFNILKKHDVFDL